MLIKNEQKEIITTAGFCLTNFNHSKVPKESIQGGKMEPINTFWFLIIGLVAGWLAGRIMKGKGFGLVGNLIVGVIGALLGGFLFSLIGLKAVGILGALIAAVVGAIILIWLLSLIRTKK